MTNNDDNLDEGFEDLDATTEASGDIAPAGEEGGDPLAAPTRNMTSGGGSKKNLFMLLGLVAVLAIGGGGAYMFLMGGDDTVAATPPAVVPDAAAPSEAAFAAPADPAAAPPADTAAAPPMPDAAAPPDALATAPAAVPGIDAPAADPAAALVDPAAVPPVDATAVPQPDATAAVPADPAAATVETTVTTTTAETTTMAAQEVPVDATAVPPVDTTAAPPADLGAPPADENIAMPLNTGAPADTAAVPPVDTATAPVTPAPTEPQPDLPMPEAAQVPATTTTTTVTPPATTTTGGMTDPSAAELAIVQNAAILDQVTQPGTASRPFDPSAPLPSQTNAIKEVDKLLQQQAIIRPLPPSWLQVSKNRDAGDMDSRLTAARSALAQNRNSAALQLFTELKATYPKDNRVLMGRAVALQKLGQNEEALGAYEAVLVANPKNLEALTNMLGLLKGKDPQLAVSKLTELHETYPYQADITAQLGVAHGQAGEYEQALRYLEMAEAMDAGSAYILYNKAVLHDKMGHNAQAGDLYRQLIRMSVDGTLDENLPLEQIKRRLSVMR